MSGQTAEEYANISAMQTSHFLVKTRTQGQKSCAKGYMLKVGLVV